MLHRKRESEATRREMLCPSCHPCGMDSRLRADKPATVCSSQETLSKSMRMEHPRESKQVQDPGQESKGEMVNILWQLPDRKKWTTSLQLQVLAGQERKVSAIWWTRDIITKTRGAQRTIQDTHTKVRVPPFLPRQHSKFPQTHLGEKGEKQKSKKDCPHFS